MTGVLSGAARDKSGVYNTARQEFGATPRQMDVGKVKGFEGQMRFP